MHRVQNDAAREGRASAHLTEFFLQHTDGREETCKEHAAPEAARLVRRNTMSYEALEKELALYEKRTPKSAAAHRRAEQRIPLGVASNYRHYEPYPIFVQDGKGSQIH